MPRSETPEPTTDEEPMPTFSEQVAGQLGGWQGMIESSIPVVMFVLVNIIWSLRPALICALAVGLAIGAVRLWRREPVRHAVNGLFGIAVGAVIAWKTGKAMDFYLPGIYLTLGYGVALVGSIAAGRPLVGWLWSVVADKGGTRWFHEEGLRRTFGWLTMVWAAVFIVKFAVNMWVYLATGLTDDQKAGILGVMRIALGAPPYAVLLALTIWAVRRHDREITAALPA
jgi:hypothetical protein